MPKPKLVYAVAVHFKKEEPYSFYHLYHKGKAKIVSSRSREGIEKFVKDNNGEMVIVNIAGLVRDGNLKRSSLYFDER